MSNPYQDCRLCEHRCGVNRLSGELGRCRATSEVRVFRHRIEYGEEPELLPCHLFYTSGCDLRCRFCIAEENAFDPSRGTELTPAFLSSAIEWGRRKGAKTLQWVGGEPTIHAPAIVDCMQKVGELPPIAWKSDFFMTPMVFDLLNPIVDWYIADFKFGNDICATEIASVPNYLAVVTRNLLLASNSKQLMIRHLLLPGHFECCVVPITEWLTLNLPGSRVNLLSGYLPRWRAQGHETLGRLLSKREYLFAKSHLEARGVKLVSPTGVVTL